MKFVDLNSARTSMFIAFSHYRARDVAINMAPFRAEIDCLPMVAIIFLILLVASNLFLYSAEVYAQTGLASFSLSVSDQNAAMIPDVKITLLNLATALQRHGTTNDQGSCVVPLLPPGKYNITVQRSGFSTWRSGT